MVGEAIEREEFKETELGLIPKDWKVKNMEEICTTTGIIRGPFGGSLKKSDFIGSGIKIYEQRNAIYKTLSKGNYYINEQKFRELERFKVRKNDFIISCSGTIGEIYRIPSNYKRGIINQALLKLTINKNEINPNYFHIYFQWGDFQDRLIDNTQGGAMKNLVGMPVFRKIGLAVPPVDEQQAIASVLSDMDELIESLEKVIDKKKKIKQGTMQQLLTGKKRLPGFTEEWKIRSLGNIAEFHRGKGLPKSQIVSEGKHKCIHYGELFTQYKESIQSVTSRTNIEKGCFNSRKNDVLMPTSDVTPNGLATASCIQEDNVILGGDILVIRIDEETLNGIFLSNVISNSKEQIMQLISGTTVYHIYAADMKEFKFISPPTLCEQNAIVEIILSMDSEIELLEERLEKYEQMKEGMMQQLLTGRIRLV